MIACCTDVFIRLVCCCNNLFSIPVFYETVISFLFVCFKMTSSTTTTTKNNHIQVLNMDLNRS